MAMYDKKKNLLNILAGYLEQDAVVAFSGGVDSSLLVKVAQEAANLTGRHVHAVTFQTLLHPVREIEWTKRLAEEIGVKHHVLHVDELAEAGLEENPRNRCYLCKKYLYGTLLEMAKTMGIATIMDGTNADDTKVYRPGLQALQELGIVSPLAAAGLTKKEVRQLAGEYGLSVAERPSTPCLATRFPYNTILTIENMERVEKGEAYLRSLGYYNVRIRVHGEIARIEVDGKDLAKAVAQRENITAQLKRLGYGYITLDLEGFRSGSMDV